MQLSVSTSGITFIARLAAFCRQLTQQQGRRCGDACQPVGRADESQRHGIAMLAWAAAHCSWTSPDDRALADNGLAGAMRSAPAWVSTVLIGVLVDVCSTLPATDPWRKLSWRAGDMIFGTSPPESTGARWPEGGPLAEDNEATGMPALAHPVSAPWQHDLGPASAALLAAACTADLTTVLEATRVLRRAVMASVISPQADVREWVRVMTEAIRWGTERRRRYLRRMGVWCADDWLWVATGAWVGHDADRILSGQGRSDVLVPHVLPG